MPPLEPRASHFGLILPLCTSSATVGLALFQYPVFNAFLTNSALAGRPLSRYWQPMIKEGVPLIAAFPALSTMAGLLAARWLRLHDTLETTEVSKWYMIGAALAAGHFAFVPAVTPLIKRMAGAGQLERKGELVTSVFEASDEEVERINREAMGKWFLWHSVRVALVDLPALWCFAEGAALSFWVI